MESAQKLNLRTDPSQVESLNTTLGDLVGGRKWYISGDLGNNPVFGAKQVSQSGE